MKTVLQLAGVFMLLATLNSPLATCSAQGTAFTYQGRLNDGTNPANGRYDFQFTLYDDASDPLAGVSITNTLVAVPLSNGLFTVTLDFGYPDSFTIFDGQEIWLGIAVRTNNPGSNYAQLMPRQMFTSTPYAITAANLGGTLSSNSFVGTYSSAVTLNNSANHFSGVFTGNGGGITNLTNLNASQLASGIVPDARLAANVARTNQVWLLNGNAGTAGGGGNFVGTTDNQSLYFKVNGLRALMLVPGGDSAADSNTNDDFTSSVIGGCALNQLGAGVVGATIAGGGAGNFDGVSYVNFALGDYGSVGGGMGNYASNIFSVVAGGRQNRASGKYSSVGGGYQNIASGDGSVIAGGGNGYGNISSGDNSTIGGGHQNTNSSLNGTIAGGSQNTASGFSSQIWTAEDATVGGGERNTASGNFSTVAGGLANIASDFYSTVSGGGVNSATGENATVSGGYGNSADVDGTVGGGYQNRCGASGTLGGGFKNISGGNGSTVGGGSFNIADAAHGNVPEDGSTTVSGGRSNNATGNFATVPGGYRCRATGDYSFAAGRRANAAYIGSFVWCDSLDQDGGSVTANSFTVRASGGVYLFTSAGSTGVQVGAGGGSWSSISDRNVKENFRPVNAQDVLARVIAMPLTTWNYKTQDKTTRHIGPMAQDFYAAFNVGEDDHHITTVDADGVALAAIKGLNQKVEEKDAKIKELEARLEKLEQLIDTKTGEAK